MIPPHENIQDAKREIVSCKPKIRKTKKRKRHVTSAKLKPKLEIDDKLFQSEMAPRISTSKKVRLKKISKSTKVIKRKRKAKLGFKKF